MINAYVHPVGVGAHVVYPVRQRHLDRVTGKVVHVHLDWLTARRPLAAAFLKSPTSSRFLVSTLTTGSPAERNATAAALTYSNCASRSGCARPSTTFTLPATDIRTP